MKKYGTFEIEESTFDYIGHDAEKLLGYMEIINQGMIDSMSKKNPTEAIESFMKKIGECIHTDRVYIFEFNNSGKFDNTFEWCAQGVKPQIDMLQNINVSDYGSEWWDAFHENHGYMIMDMEAYHDVDAKLYEMLKMQYVSRIMVCPLSIEGRLLGFFGVDNPPVECMKTIMPLFQIAANYFSVVLMRRRNLGFIEEITHIDKVTGLYSSNIFHRSLDEFLKAMSRGEVTGTWDVICFNIHQFKAYNYQNGYDAGDKLLKEVGKTICRVAKTDCVTRENADHFYALVEDQNAEEIVRQVHDIMADRSPESVFICMGIYELSDSDISGKYAVDCANMAAQSVSDDLNSYYSRFNSGMEAGLRKKAYLLSHIDKAISSGWIKVYYQPIMGTWSGKIAAFEALSRWDDPVYGFLNPDEFISILEEAKLLYKLDFFVLEVVCSDIRSGINSGRLVCPVSINLSRHDLETAAVHDRINNILKRFEVPHDLVHIEITETTLLDNEKILQSHIEQFHKDGYEIWMDDFGSGYSSLNTLQNYAFDCIKIDMQFLREANEHTEMIISNIINMAKQLKIQTLTEGVETERQYKFLLKIGCSLAQGYYFSKPESLMNIIISNNQKGIQMETPAENIFYREVGKVNILSTVNPIGSPDTPEEIPVAVIEFDEDFRYRILYSNDTCMEYIKMMNENVSGYSADNKENNKDDVKGMNRWHTAIIELAEAARNTKKAAVYDFVTNGAVGRMVMKLITEYGGKSAFIVRGMNISSFKKSSVNRLSIVQDLYSLFEHVEIFMPYKNEVHHIFGGSGENINSEITDLRKSLDLFASKNIQETERERFLEFMNPDTMGRRVRETPNHVLNSFFYLKNMRDDYEWKRFILAEAQDSEINHEKYIFCIGKNLVGWDRERLLLSKEQNNVASDIEVGKKSEDIIHTEDIWNALLKQRQLGMFWKDKNRKFIGVNEAFLHYYNMSPADLIGRNDEDMRWHPDPEPFKKDEESVLQDGKVITAAMGECVVKGEVRRIMASKAPVYSRGKICGLVGFFVDVTDAMDKSVIYHESLYSDQITGLLNKNGFEENKKIYVEKYTDENKKFAYISIQVLELKQYSESFGIEACGKLLKKVGSEISSVLDQHGTVGHIYTGKFGICADCKNETELMELEEKLGNAISDIRYSDEKTPVTIYFMIGSCMYEKRLNIEETVSIAESRMISKVKNVRSHFAFSSEEIVSLMRSYMNIFDFVRLVNPQTNKVFSVNSDDRIYEYPYECYTFLGKEEKCSDCISARTVVDRTNHEKVEINNGVRYRIFSQYVEVNGRPYSFECLKRMLSKEQEKSLL